jgi:hypothetical protein
LLPAAWVVGIAAGVSARVVPWGTDVAGAPGWGSLQAEISKTKVLKSTNSRMCIFFMFVLLFYYYIAYPYSPELGKCEQARLFILRGLQETSQNR